MFNRVNEYSVTYNVTCNECIAGNGLVLERSDTNVYMKEWYKAQYLYDSTTEGALQGVGVLLNGHVMSFSACYKALKNTYSFRIHHVSSVVKVR